MDITDNKVAKKLIDHFGGRAPAARRLGKSVEAMRLWLENGIPLSQAIDVEHKSGGVVTAEEILQDAKAEKLAELEQRAA